MITATAQRLEDSDPWTGTWHDYQTGTGKTEAEAKRNAVRYLPLGYGGHNRSERTLEAIASGQTVATPLGTYRVVVTDEGEAS